MDAASPAADITASVCVPAGGTLWAIVAVKELAEVVTVLSDCTIPRRTPAGGEVTLAFRETAALFTSIELLARLVTSVEAA